MNYPQDFPARIFCKNFLQDFPPNFPQDFPPRFSCKIFPNNFPQEFSARISCKNFQQDFPARISHKIFLQDFPELDPDWLAPHHPIPNAKFSQITTFLKLAFSPPPCPTNISHKIFPQDFSTRISHQKCAENC